MKIIWMYYLIGIIYSTSMTGTSNYYALLRGLQWNPRATEPGWGPSSETDLISLSIVSLTWNYRVWLSLSSQIITDVRLPYKFHCCPNANDAKQCRHAGSHGGVYKSIRQDAISPTTRHKECHKSTLNALTIEQVLQQLQQQQQLFNLKFHPTSDVIHNLLHVRRN